jgi:hypothetical protein
MPPDSYAPERNEKYDKKVGGAMIYSSLLPNSG